jgi:hypothetical protein
MIGLKDVATVYSADPTTTEYSVVEVAELPCRLAHPRSGGAGTAPDRAEMEATRLLLWGPDYEMPETAQIEVNGVRWNIQAGTLGRMSGPLGTVVYRRAHVVRAA